MPLFSFGTAQSAAACAGAERAQRTTQRESARTEAESATAITKRVSAGLVLSATGDGSPL